MKEYKPMPIDEMFALPRKQFIDRFEAWIHEFNDDELLDIDNPLECPLHLWVVHNRAKCRQEMVGNTASCPLCGHPVCPDCLNHNVDVISRITGYMSTVSGWGAAKKQEFKDRQRHDIAGR